MLYRLLFLVGSLTRYFDLDRSVSTFLHIRTPEESDIISGQELEQAGIPDETRKKEQAELELKRDKMLATLAFQDPAEGPHAQTTALEDEIEKITGKLKVLEQQPDRPPQRPPIAFHLEDSQMTTGESCLSPDDGDTSDEKGEADISGLSGRGSFSIGIHSLLPSPLSRFYDSVASFIAPPIKPFYSKPDDLLSLSQSKPSVESKALSEASSSRGGKMEHVNDSTAGFCQRREPIEPAEWSAYVN